MSKRPIFKEGRMNAYSITLPEEYATALRIAGKGFLSQGVRVLIETYAPDLVEEIRKWKLEKIHRYGHVAKKRWPEISNQTVDFPECVEKAQTISKKRRELFREG